MWGKKGNPQFCISKSLQKISSVFVVEVDVEWKNIWKKRREENWDLKVKGHESIHIFEHLWSTCGFSWKWNLTPNYFVPLFNFSSRSFFFFFLFLLCVLLSLNSCVPINASYIHWHVWCKCCPSCELLCIECFLQIQLVLDLIFLCIDWQS